MLKVGLKNNNINNGGVEQISYAYYVPVLIRYSTAYRIHFDIRIGLYFLT